MTSNIDAGIEFALGILAQENASALALRAGADRAFAVVRSIEEASVAAVERRAQCLTDLTPPLAKIMTTLAAIRDEDQNRELQREVATAIGDRLDARARERAKFEAVRDEARKPFEAQTRRAQDLAEKVRSVYSTNASRIVELFHDDVFISGLGRRAYSIVPRPRGNYVGIEMAWLVPRVLATPGMMAATKLPPHWPPRYSDFSILDTHDHHEDDDDEIIRPIRAMVKKGPASEIEVDTAIARAQARVLDEYREASVAIEDVLRLDDAITPHDRDLRYPDGAPVFDQALFPAFWLIGMMRRRIHTPSIAAAKAA